MEPSLTKLASEGLKRYLCDCVYFPRDLLSLIVQYCIPCTLFVVHISYLDKQENRLVYEIAREERDHVWSVKELIELLESRKYPTIAPHVALGLRLLLHCEPTHTLSTALMRLEEEHDIGLTIKQIDLLQMRQKTLDFGCSKWSDWLPIQLHYTEE